MTEDGQERRAKRASGAREAEVLAVLQESGEALKPGEVAERLGGGLSYSTVVTILGRMHEKKILTRTRRGRAYAYRPVTDDTGFAARRMRGVLDGRADRDAVLTRFVNGLSSTDEELLRQLLGPDLDPGS